MPPFTLYGNTVDPDEAQPGQFPVDAANTNYIVLQIIHHLDVQETQELRRRGAQIMSLEQETEDTCTYLCRYEPSDLEPLRELPFVRAAFVYHTDLVIHPLLLREESDAPQLGGVRRETIQSPTDSETTASSPGKAVEVMVTLHHGSDETGAWVFDQLQGMCDSVEIAGLRKVASDANVLRAWVPESKLRQLAALDCVASLHPAYKPKLRTVAARTLIGIPPPPTFTSAVLGEWGWPTQRYQGSGQIVAVSDTGLDLGYFVGETVDNADVMHIATLIRNQPGAVVTAVQALESARELLDAAVPPPGFSSRNWLLQNVLRIVNSTNKVNFGHPPAPQWLLDEEFHGSHVAGCVAGNYTLQGAQGFGPLKVTGTAPAAQLYIQGMDGTAMDRADQAYAAGARIQNCSWGLGQPHQLPYAPNGQEVDQVTEKYPGMLIVYAAGNTGDELKPEAAQPLPPAPQLPVWNKQVGAESAAKNALIVGATWSTRRMAPHTGNPTFVYDDTACVEFTIPQPIGSGQFPANQLAGFSEKGPTLEGFLKPDVVAPGLGVLSMKSRSPSRPIRRGRVNYTPDPLTEWQSGTSMSAPFVSGLAACIREAATAQIGIDLPARTLRAIIVNAAESLQGHSFQYAVAGAPGGALTFVTGPLGDPPDCGQGFGLVSYPRSLAHLPLGLPTSAAALVEGKDFEDTPSGFCQHLKIKHGETKSFLVYLKAEAVGRTFTATLVYDDKSTALTGALQANLDLSLSVWGRGDVKNSQLVNDVPHRAVQNLPGYNLPPGLSIQLGTVRKAYLSNPLPDPGPTRKLAVRITVSARRTTPPNFAVPFTVAWMTV